MLEQWLLFVEERNIVFFPALYFPEYALLHTYNNMCRDTCCMSRTVELNILNIYGFFLGKWYGIKVSLTMA